MLQNLKTEELYNENLRSMNQLLVSKRIMEFGCKFIFVYLNPISFTVKTFLPLSSSP